MDKLVSLFLFGLTVDNYTDSMWHVFCAVLIKNDSFATLDDWFGLAVIVPFFDHRHLFKFEWNINKDDSSWCWKGQVCYRLMLVYFSRVNKRVVLDEADNSWISNIVKENILTKYFNH